MKVERGLGRSIDIYMLLLSLLSLLLFFCGEGGGGEEGWLPPPSIVYARHGLTGTTLLLAKASGQVP